MPISLSLKEPKTADYIYIDAQNRVHLLMPIVGGDSIGLDNTCKTVMELQTFFYGKDKRPSALAVLKDYQQKLEADIQFLQQTGAYADLIVQKQQRLTQIKQNTALLTMVKDKFVQKDAPFPDFPRAVHTLLARSTNCFTTHLSPRVPDFVLRVGSPTFSLARQQPKYDHSGYLETQPPDNFRGLGPELREAIARELTKPRPSSPSAKDIIIAEVVKHYEGKPPPTLAELQEYAQELIFEKYVERVNLKKTNGQLVIDEDYLDNLLLMPYDDKALESSSGTLFHASGLSDEFWAGLKQSKLIEPDEALSTEIPQQSEKVTMAVQFLLASVNIYCKAKGLSTKDFGPVLEGQMQDIARRVATSLVSENGTVEEEVFKIINELKGPLGLSRQLTSQDKEAIKQEFTLHYNIIKDSPHLDEFIMFRQDIPGDFFNHKNRISISFTDLINLSLSTLPREVGTLVAPLQDNLNALKTGQDRKLEPNNPTPTSTFQSFLASLNVTNYEQRTTFLCSQIKDANALLKQLNYEELQGLFKHPLWPQMAGKMLNDPDKNNSAVYVQAIQKAQDYVAMVDRKLVSAIGEEFNSHLFNDSSKWSAAVANLQESIQSYNGKLLYRFKSDERKSQIKALETLCQELESLSSSALPTKISPLSKIIVELSHLSKTIKEGQPGKKSTLASKIDSVKAKVIELFDLSKSPIGLSSQDPMKSLLAYEETRLGDLKVHQSLSHLDSQWWSDEGMAVIKQLPKSCYNYDTVQLLNTTKPSQFDASVVKAIKTDERFISADFAALQKRGRFIQAIEERTFAPEVKEALFQLGSEWSSNPDYLDKLTPLKLTQVPPEMIRFLNKTDPALLDQRILTGLIFQMGRKQPIEIATLATLQEAGRRCELLGDLAQDYPVLGELNTKWWTEQNMALVKTLDKSFINQHLVTFLNSIQPQQLTEEVKQGLMHWNKKNPLALMTLCSLGAAYSELSANLDEAIKRYAAHTKSKWFDFGGVRDEKNKLIENGMKQAIVLLKETGNNVSEAQAILKVAKARIEELFQDKQEKQWSWFRFKYIVPESGKILNEVIAKLQPYVEQARTLRPRH